MNRDKIRRLATDILDLSAEGYEPGEFQMGLELALASYFCALFPTELGEALQLHQHNLTKTVEELDGKRHRDDQLEIDGFTL